MRQEKLVENFIDGINKTRAEMNLNQIVLSENEKNNFIDLCNKIDNKELNKKIFFNYFFNNSFSDYIDLIDEIISNSVEDNKTILINNNDKQTKIDVNKNTLIDIINSYFDSSFISNKNYFYLKDNSVGVLAMQSKLYDMPSCKYWYTYHTYQERELKKFKESYLLLFFKDNNEGLIIPVSFIEKYLDKSGKTETKNGIGYHIHIEKIEDDYFLRVPFDPLIPLNDYKLRKESVEVIKISSNFKQVNMKKRK